MEAANGCNLMFNQQNSDNVVFDEFFFIYNRIFISNILVWESFMRN